jgi:hypothetical protein
MPEQTEPNGVPPELVPPLRRLAKLAIELFAVGRDLMAGTAKSDEAPTELIRLYGETVKLAEEEPLTFSAAAFGVGCVLGYLCHTSAMSTRPTND